MNNLEHIYSIFQPILAPFGQLVIAGGAVRDTLMGRTPKDYDLFILTDYKQSIFEEIKLKLGEALRLGNFASIESKIEWHKSEPYLIESIKYNGAELQIMVNFSKDIYQLVDGFDWNVSLFAYGHLPNENKVGYHSLTKIEDIKSGEYLKLHKLTFPYSTLRRGYRFSERFLMRINGETIRQICAAIMELEKKKLDAKTEKDRIEAFNQVNLANGAENRIV